MTMNAKNEFKTRASLLVLLFILMIPFGTLAQTIRLSGQVTDTANEPIIGASIKEKGTNRGVITDFNGNFTLNVSPQAILTISYVGYITQEVPVGGKNELHITLQENNELLDEVVVVGYGTLKKSDMTGAISSVNADELTKRTTTNPAEALQGKVAGVSIKKSSGAAGAGVQVRIRGIKSFGGTSPLWIIDGFPGDIDTVNPQDILSMEILKDGAAAAIYGSIAANGVIIVTTKNGTKNEGIKVDFNTYVSVTGIAKQMEMLNAAEYKEVHRQMFQNYMDQYPTDTKIKMPAFVTKDTGIDTDWQDAVLRSGLSQNYMLSLRGGSEKAQYSLSYNHTDEKGILLGDDYRTDNARLKLHLSKYIFDLDANIGFKYGNSQSPHYSLKEMYMLSPLVPIYDDSREYGYGLSDFDDLPNNRNIMADQHYNQAYSKKWRTTANASLNMRLLPGLTFKTAYAYRNEQARSASHAPVYMSDPKSKHQYPTQSESSSYWEEQILDNVLNYSNTFGRHSLNVMVGSSITAEKYTWHSVDVEGKTTTYKVEDGKLVTGEEPGGFLDESFDTINAGEGGTFSGGGSKYTYNRASFFGRLNYNFDDRYLAQVTVRYDGSSKFGKDSRWGCFPSIALGWRISQEKFFPKDMILDNLKFRASWGRLGNESALGRYDFMALISTGNGLSAGYVRGNGENAWPGSIARGLENRSLQWETTDTKNIGFDFGFFRSKLSGSINYYYNQTEDLLITKVLPPSAGMENPVLNVGQIRNTGVELELNWNDVVKDFNYNIGFNISTINNKVVKLSDESQVLKGAGLKYGSEHFPTETKVGKPIGSFYLYQTDGLFQSMDEVKAYVNKEGELLQPNARPGDIRFKDMDGNGVIDDDDKVYSGSGIPTLEANLNLSGSYKGFDLSLMFGSAWNFKLYNGNKYLYEGMNSKSNMLKSTLHAWTPEHPDTKVPRAVYQDPNGNMRESDRYLGNGNFLRLRQAQLGYTLPSSLTQKCYIEKLRFYVSGENLFTLTGYDGLDPEFTNNVLNSGVDMLIYPFTRSFTIGAQLTF